MRFQRPSRSLATAAATLALLVGALGAPAHAEESSSPSSDVSTLAGAHPAAGDDVPLPPQLKGYQLADPPPDVPSWGEAEYDSLTCQYGDVPVAGRARVAQWFKGGLVPQPGETFYVQLEYSYIGSACAGSTSTTIQTELMLPTGMEAAYDPAAGNHVIQGIVRPKQEVKYTTNFAGSTGPHGGVLIQSTNAAGTAPMPWTLSRHEGLMLFVPVTATRRLIGSGTPPPSCTWRRQGGGVCPAAGAGDHVQFGVRATHMFNVSGGWYAPYVGVFATETPGVPGTPNQPGNPGGPIGQPTKPMAGLSARAATGFVAGRSGAVAVTVDGRGGSAAGTVVVRDGARVVGSARVGSAVRAAVRVPVRALRAGRRSLSVTYGGSNRLKGSSTAVRVVVAKAPAAVAAKASRLTKRGGKLAVTVRASGVALGGTVVVKDGSKVVGRAKVSASGRATVRLKALKRGKRTLTVVFGGNADVRSAATKVRVRVR
ncbi:Ig-like domain repeat protein [Aeromicrobium massiliense]|uniref:Ig-like domain repeat protein n=1 Tax=Aeromicrobium massiliense TaxID=1464554 RepID=UPI0002DBE68A|nr:Ig-like domain repeat protein [Aeromicrobium massiliense]